MEEALVVIMQAPHNTPSSAVFLNNQRGDFSGCLWLFTKDTYSHLFSSTSFQKILSRSFFRASTSQCHFGARLRVVCVSPTTYNTTRRQERILRAHTQTRGDGRVSSHRKEEEEKKRRVRERSSGNTTPPIPSRDFQNSSFYHCRRWLRHTCQLTVLCWCLSGSEFAADNSECIRPFCFLL